MYFRQVHALAKMIMIFLLLCGEIGRGTVVPLLNYPLRRITHAFG